MPALTDSPPRSGTRTRLLGALFVIYLVLLTWIVLWKLALPWIGEAALLPHPLKLIPFLPDANDGPSAPIEVIGNLLLFVPFGIYLGLLAPSWQWWKAAGVFLGASLIFEIVEPLLSIGSFDTTDLIVNTAGGLAGLGLMALARRMLGTRSAVVLTRVCAIGTAIALIAIGIFVASPLRYAPQHDVLVSPLGMGERR